ncbi:CRISPR-associated endonuclease Cas2 [uncultured Porphyromonas sp.]|uniref:CRISPR-associated endonuclease Cas2 n=1 Tax=uncultured Porphyromonas sp. TaxID=159274 RepID=UPI0025945DFE|nr:CRISPR-associated endonuclease Cas2 [uncultured Porphyromonas sp.]
MRKKREPISPLEALRKLAQAGVQDSPRPTRHIDQDLDELPSLESRISCLLGIANETSRPTTNMIFFTMYDIESNKVRRLIAKYLISKGCTRIQDSIFLADLPRPTYEEIKRDLAEVESLYDNHDSIIVCPISTDQLHAMHVIGEQVDVDIITHKRNTLFY